MIKNLKNQVAVITGGMGGIGKVVSVRLAELGCKAIVIGRHAKRDRFFHDAYWLDVADAAKVKKTIARILKEYKRLDILVNAAGVLGAIGPFHLNDLNLWARTIAVNLLGTANMCHAVLPFMIRQKKGKIVNFAGGGAVQPFLNFSAYAASKAAVVRFTENLASEYEAKNIQINAIAPGLINTKMLDDAIKAGRKLAGEAYFQRVAEAKKRGGDDPRVAADLVAWLSNPQNKITGKLISAKWDPWRKFNSKSIKKFNDTSAYTLRRIDNKNFKEISR